VVVSLLDGIIHTDRVDSGGPRLHLNLRIVYAGLVIEELLREEIREESPVKKKVIRSKAH
jgi:hypothetical protein